MAQHEQTTQVELDLSSIVFQGVKPKCLHGRWVHTEMGKSPQTLIVYGIHLHQLLQMGFHMNKLDKVKNKGKNASGDHCPRSVKKETVSIPPVRNKCTCDKFLFPIPETFNERIIGTPTCIACDENVFIIQYITDKSKFVHFMLADSKTGKLFFFEDEERYFHKQFATLYAVECLVSPGMRTVLFRLPQPIMTMKKWSKMLFAELERTAATSATCVGGHVQYKISNIRCGTFRDRKNQAVAFDPRYRERIVYALLNEYCSTCKLMLYDLFSTVNIHQKECRLEYPWMKCRAASKTDIQLDSDSDDADNEYFFLQSCNMDICKSGEIIAITCMVQSAQDHKYHIRLYLFDTDSLQLLYSDDKHCQEISYIPLCGGKQKFKPVCISNPEKQMCVPVFSPCDSVVSVWILEKGKILKPTDMVCKLPKALQLGPLCRAVILQNVTPCNLKKLPLPRKLLPYLKFQPHWRTFVG